MNRKVYWGWALALGLMVAGAGVLRAQEAPAPPVPPEPPIAPVAPVAPVSPEPTIAPDPPEDEQIFVMNDGTTHLGVNLSDVTTEKAQELKLPAVAGAIVTHVQENSPASKAGLQKGDAIMEFDGVRVRSSAELRRLIRETPAGRTVEMKIVRDGKTQVLSAKLQGESESFFSKGLTIAPPAVTIPDIHIPPQAFSLYGFNRATLGISGDDLTSQLAEYFGVKQGKGVLISEVTKGGAADKAGLKAGDVIVQVDGKPIDGVDDLRSALNDNFTDDTRKVSLTIVRNRQEQTITAELTRTSHYHQEQSSSVMEQNLAAAQARLQMAQEKAAQAQELLSARAALQAELEKQRAQMKAEWQQQLRQQMLSLRDQLKEMQHQRVALRQNELI